MSREAFINEVELVRGNLSSEALAYFDKWKNNTSTKKESPVLTDNGKLILRTMQDNKELNGNMFKARDIAELAFMASRSVSGSIRKLVTDGFVEKIGADPIVYSLTDKGSEFTIED